jgi:glyoxylase-like metal-dependent hydrolase (beta-lactamase superfamily II)
MRISSRVYLLASGHLGCSFSHPNDCNVYAVRCGSRYFLIDTGVGLNTDRILSELESDKIQPAQVEGILLTHGHLDHSGGAALLHEALGAPVFSSRQTADAMERADEQAISLAAAKSAGIYGPEVRLTACPVERVLEDHGCFDAGDSRITPIHTPGHSHDMLSYLVESPDGRLLFPGDTVFHGGKILLSATWDCDPQAYAVSLRSLSQLTIEGLYPGHGLWSVNDSSRHLEQSLRFVNQLLLPPNLM